MAFRRFRRTPGKNGLQKYTKRLFHQGVLNEYFFGTAAAGDPVWIRTCGPPTRKSLRSKRIMRHELPDIVLQAYTASLFPTIIHSQDPITPITFVNII